MDTYHWTCLAGSILLLLALTLNAGCNSLDFSTSAEPVRLLEVDIQERDELLQNPANIESLRISNHTLIVEVAFRGGCGKHSFSLYSPGPSKATYPPGANLYLSHDVQGPSCEETDRRTLRFDLRPIQARATNNMLLFVWAPAQDDFEQPVLTYEY